MVLRLLFLVFAVVVLYVLFWAFTQASGRPGASRESVRDRRRRTHVLEADDEPAALEDRESKPPHE